MGVPASIEKAKELYSESAENGDEEAEEALRRISSAPGKEGSSPGSP